MFDICLLVLGIILFIIKLKKEKLLSRTKTQMIFKNAITVFLTFLIVGILNYIIIKKSEDIDLTNEKIHSLTDKSFKILSKIDSKLELTVFAQRENWDPYLKLLELYERGSELVSINAVDPVKSPLIASQYGVESNGQILIKFKGKSEVLKKVNELGLTNKILKLTVSKRRNLCAVNGHGEYNIGTTTNNGLSFLNKQIQSSSYALKEIELRDDLNDCDVLLFIGLKSDLLKEDVLSITNFIKKGKSILIALGPNFSEYKRTNAYKFLKSLGVEVKNSVVIDRLSSVHRVDATINVVDNYSKHPIVSEFKEKAYMPLNLNLGFNESDTDISALFSSKAFPASWAEVDLESLKKGKATYDTKDIKGPNHLAVAIDNKESFYRAVIFGSDQFILNAYQGQSSNFNIFFNSLDWLLGEEEIISLDRANLSNQSFSLSTPAVNTIFYIVIIFFPFILFLIAGFVYFRNKKL